MQTNCKDELICFVADLGGVAGLLTTRHIMDWGCGDWIPNFPGNMYFNLVCMAFFDMSSTAINVRTGSGRVG